MKLKMNLLAVAILIVILIGGAILLRGRLGTAVSPQSRQTASTSAPGGSMGTPSGGPGGPGADFEKTHRYTLQFMKLLGNIGRIEKDGKASLSADQARRILAIIEPLQKLDTLEEPQARKAFVELQGALSDEQRAAISALPAEPRFHRGTPPPPGPAPSGSPPSTDRGKMRGLNPLNPPSDGPMPDGQNGPAAIIGMLEKKSGGAL